jgi:hypothetical protein
LAYWAGLPDGPARRPAALAEAATLWTTARAAHEEAELEAGEARDSGTEAEARRSAFDIALVLRCEDRPSPPRLGELADFAESQGAKILAAYLRDASSPSPTPARRRRTTLSVRLTFSGRDVEKAQAMVSKMLDVGVFQDEIRDWAAAEGVKIKIRHSAVRTVPMRSKGANPAPAAEPLAPTYSVLKGNRFLVSGVSLDAALAASGEEQGHACVIDDATDKPACMIGVEHACQCEVCSPEAWSQGERESLAADVAAAREALAAEGSAS